MGEATEVWDVWLLVLPTGEEDADMGTPELGAVTKRPPPDEGDDREDCSC